MREVIRTAENFVRAAALIVAVAMAAIGCSSGRSAWADSNMWYQAENSDYYMKHQNNGRRFIIAGFSQGAMLCLDLLKHMSDKEFERMIACYAIGYRLSADDLRHPHIKAAQGPDDCGVVVSFNSTLSREANWPLVSEGSVTCINPINWQTDSTPAEFTFDGTTNTVSVDTKTQVLLVDTDSPEYYHSFYDLAPFFTEAGVSIDNLHHWDLLFYASRIRDNALLRAGECGRR